MGRHLLGAFLCGLAGRHRWQEADAPIGPFRFCTRCGETAHAASGGES